MYRLYLFISNANLWHLNAVWKKNDHYDNLLLFIIVYRDGYEMDIFNLAHFNLTAGYYSPSLYYFHVDPVSRSKINFMVS